MTWLILALELLPSAAVCQAPAPSAASLPADGQAGRYVDLRHGFWLVAPAGTERVRETSTRRLVAWVQRDEKTGAIRWTLEVLFALHAPTSMPAAEYASRLADELTQAGQFKVERHSVGAVDGRPAMNFKGVWTSGKLSWWRAQTWVQASPKENLILSITGQLADKEELESILSSAASSLKLFDPAKFLEQRRQSLQAGAALLARLKTPLDIQPLLSKAPSYFLVELGGRRAGFLKVSEGLVTRDRVQLVQVVRLGALKLEGQPLRLTREELLAAPDRTVETAKRIMREGPAPAGQTVQELAKDGPVMRVRTTRGTSPPAPERRDLPDAIGDAYLPLAFDVLVNRIVARAQPGDYGFAVYDGLTNDFQMRLVRVVGKERLRVNGATVEATHLTDQAAVDAPVADVWMDAGGDVLRVATGDGPSLVRSDRKTVAAEFSAELLELEKLGS